MCSEERRPLTFIRGNRWWLYPFRCKSRDFNKTEDSYKVPVGHTHKPWKDDVGNSLPEETRVLRTSKFVFRNLVSHRSHGQTPSALVPPSLFHSGCISRVKTRDYRSLEITKNTEGYVNMFGLIIERSIKGNSNSTNFYPEKVKIYFFRTFHDNRKGTSVTCKCITLT